MRANCPQLLLPDNEDDHDDDDDDHIVMIAMLKCLIMSNMWLPHQQLLQRPCEGRRKLALLLLTALPFAALFLFYFSFSLLIRFFLPLFHTSAARIIHIHFGFLLSVYLF